MKARRRSPTASSSMAPHASRLYFCSLVSTPRLLTYQHALAATGCEYDEWAGRGRWSGRRGGGGHHALVCMQGSDRPPCCAAPPGAECPGTTFVRRHELARRICGVDPVRRRAGTEDDGRRRSAEEEDGRSPSGPLPACWPATHNMLQTFCSCEQCWGGGSARNIREPSRHFEVSAERSEGRVGIWGKRGQRYRWLGGPKAERVQLTTYVGPSCAV